MQRNNNDLLTDQSSSIQFTYNPHPLKLFFQNLGAATQKRMNSFGMFFKSSVSSSPIVKAIKSLSSAPDYAYPLLSPEVENKAEVEIPLNPNKYAPDILIVGAGPWGLLRAIQLKTKLPTKDIVVIERYETYTRDNELKVDLENIDNKVIHAALLAEVNNGAILNNTTLTILAKRLEEILKNHALKLGIKLNYGKYVSRKQLESGYPNCKIVVAADGAHSTVRNTIFGDDKHILEIHPMQHLLRVAYTTQNQVHKLNKKILHRTELLSDFPFEENVRYDKKTNQTTVSARFFLDEETYHKIEGGSFKNPLKLNSSLPENVKSAISAWLNTRDEDFISEPVLTKIFISAFNSKIHALNQNNKSYFLGGDAGSGYPYFRSYNEGLKAGPKLDEILLKHFATGQDHTVSEKLLDNYNTAKLNAFNFALTKAALKDSAIDSGKNALLLSAASSIQVNYWNREQRAKIQKLHPLFLRETENIKSEVIPSQRKIV